MSFELGGISGHIDHIVAARAACFMFCELRERYGHQVARLRLRCLTRDDIPTHNTDWLYMESGKLLGEIDEIVDARAYHDKIVTVFRAHHSQRKDGETHIARYGKDLGLNYFIVKE